MNYLLVYSIENHYSSFRSGRRNAGFSKGSLLVLMDYVRSGLTLPGIFLVQESYPFRQFFVVEPRQLFSVSFVCTCESQEFLRAAES